MGLSLKTTYGLHCLSLKPPGGANRVRAITSANDVDPRVQEVLDLPVFNLADTQVEDPNLVFTKELL